MPLTYYGVAFASGDTITARIRFGKDNLVSLNDAQSVSNLEKYLIKNTTNYWIKLFTKMSIPCGPIYNIKQAVENPQVKSRNMIVSSTHKKIGKFKMAGNPIKMSNYKDSKTRGEIPELDQHRKKILKDFKIKN